MEKILLLIVLLLATGCTRDYTYAILNTDTNESFDVSWCVVDEGTISYRRGNVRTSTLNKNLVCNYTYKKNK